MQVTAENLREIAHYDPDTGIFTSTIDRLPCRIGDVIGKVQTRTGYVQATIFRQVCLIHRLAWLYMTGEWPSGQIDHRNGNRSDNRWANLREATNGENGIASGATWGKLGIRGVHAVIKHGNLRYRAVLARKHLGFFKTPEEAKAAYARAARLAYGEFAQHL